MTATARAASLRDHSDLVRVLGTPLSDEQLAAATAPLEPAAVVAGAGTGKTTVMCARVVWLVGRGLVAPEQVLGLTFSRKAAGELARRVRLALRELRPPSPALVDDDADRPGEPTVSTYHAYAGGLVAEHGPLLGVEPDLRVVSDATRFQLAARVVAAAPTLSTTLSAHLPTVVRYLLDLDAQLQDHLVTPEQVRRHGRELRAMLATADESRDTIRAVDTSLARDDLLGLVLAYRNAKLEAGVAEFHDQMAWGARLAIEVPTIGAVERDRFPVVLLDEYQDTSVSQRRMLQGMFGGPDGLGHPVMAVGDPYQAVYGWRGASADNIDAFDQHFPRADGSAARRHRLSINRRSAQAVIGVANVLAEPLQQAHPSGAPLVPPPGALPGVARVAMHETVADEVAWVVDQVAALHAAHTAADDTAAWSDIAVLVRDRSEVAELARALRRRRVPVEVVGLSGLLTQPEVADVLATLRVVHELTANAALLRLLTGPRWRIGVRDLALLGERAKDLVDNERSDGSGLRARLDQAVRGIDPTDVVALADALADPGDKGYSDAARERFASLAAELDALRRHAGEPLVDLVRRTIDMLGLEVELAACPGPDADQARDNLALFVDAVAQFAGADHGASLPALLAYLDAEAEYDKGMEVAEPTLTNAVTLLTVHAAKGVEWRSVLVPFVAHRVFPSTQGRPRWHRVSCELPWPLRGDSSALPCIKDWTRHGVEQFVADCQRAQLLEERRLAYVAVTRAKQDVVLSGHWWGRTQERPRGPSTFLGEARDHLDRTGVLTMGDPWRRDEPAVDAVNPLVAGRAPVGFPAPLDATVFGRRRLVATVVREVLGGGSAGESPDPARMDEADRDRLARLVELDDELDALLAAAAEARADQVVVPLPGSVPATLLSRLRDDEGAVARELARPVPRRPSAAARFGARFHAWVEGHVGQPALLDPNEVPGRADSDIDDDAELAEVVARFQQGPYGHRVPVAVEAPFHLVLRGQLVTGRIDAVYRAADGTYEVVDWKTGRSEDADPVQLAVYRLAWAEMHRLAPDQVRARFHHVRSGRDVERDDLPGREALEALVGG